MPTAPLPFDSAIIGGGFFGCRTALALAAKGHRVLLIEQGPKLAAQASTFNQSRLHNGYHYPRSLMTAMGAHAHYKRFQKEYAPFIINNFNHVYAIAGQGSKTNPHQFERFCKYLAIPCTPAATKVRELFDTVRIKAVYNVDEVGLDTQKIMASLHAKIAAHEKIILRTGTRCTALHTEARTVRLECGSQSFTAHNVFNMTYGGLNQLLTASDFKPLGLKTELVEMPLVKLPSPLKGLGFTVMDGPFFSCMPFGRNGSHTFSHVRYTPHHQQTNAASNTYQELAAYQQTNATHFPFMRNDAARYLPAMRNVEYQSSIWQVKVVPQKHETDDGRPILMREHLGKLGHSRCIVSVLGSKLDSIYEWENLLNESF